MSSLSLVHAAESTWAVVAVLVVAAVLSFVWAQIEKRRESVLIATLERLGARGEITTDHAHPVVDLHRCIGSGSCVYACPQKHVLGVIQGQAKLLDPLACTGCQECLRACPVEAVTLSP